LKAQVENISECTKIKGGKTNKRFGGQLVKERVTDQSIKRNWKRAISRGVQRSITYKKERGLGDSGEGGVEIMHKRRVGGKKKRFQCGLRQHGRRRGG